MENILFSIIGKIAEFTVQPIGRELCYPCFMSGNIEKLNSQVEKLKANRESVQDRVNSARRNAEDIKPGVEEWLSKVDDIIEKSGILVDASQQVRLCSNLVQRHKLSKKAKKMAEEILGMKDEWNSKEVSDKGHVTAGNSLKKLPDFLDFESRKLTMVQIMDALLDNSVSMIGVYGMGGVGKTMLVKEISRKVMEEKLLDEVITVTVSQTPNLERIQKQLADMLGLKFEQETVEGRALKLHKRLKMEKNILIVFDDIWEHIDLETIGIPVVADSMGCKILFTCRNKHVLSNEMCIKSNQIFEIKVLGEDESWNLFKKIVGEIVEICDLKPIAVQIVKECARLPIAITTVAKALQNKSSSIWKDALNQLKNHVAVDIGEMDKKVYSSLKLSYDYLQGKDVKLLFLLCSMFPEDFSIEVEDLHVYAMGMGFLHGVDTVAQGRCRITKLVDDLISSSLLLQSKFSDTRVKMHDLVRDVAILIASHDDQIRTLSCVKRLNELEEKKISGNHTAVYLNIIEGLKSPLQKLILPKVQLLELHGPWSGDRSQELAETFFEEMKELKGLKLTGIKVSLLPQSLNSFANVRLLHLLDCELGNIDMIGELKKLEILSFRGSNIIQIPMAISQLTELKVFDLSSCEQLKVILPNILSKLTKLEELYLETFTRWEGEELNKERKNASLYELRYLLHLSTLSLSIQDEKIMPKQLFPRELNLEKFRITIGGVDMYLGDNQFRRVLCLEMESGSCLDCWIKMLLKRCEKLYLLGSIGARVLHFELDENESSHLKSLDLRNNLEFQYFIHKQNKPLRKILSNLEVLQLRKLENLESIIHGHVEELPLNKLRKVHVWHCNKLGSLFYNCILDDILNLEEIAVGGCQTLEVIAVMAGKETTATIEFTHLKSLSLYNVPRVRGFCSKIEQIGESSLDNSQKLQTSKIMNDCAFFNKEVLLPNLEELNISGAHNLKMIWHDMLIPNSFSKLERVEIESCDNLEKVFPSNIMSILACLKVLTIKECKLLKCIFEEQEPNALLSNLRHLELCNLPNLECVWSKDYRELLIFENIKVLSIQECPKLKRAYPIKVLKQQEDLQIDVSRLKEILETFQAETTVQQQDGRELLSKLKTLELSGSLDHNSTQLPIEIIRIVHNLKRFEVRRMFITKIFPNERLMNMEEQKNTRFEPLELGLFELPKLTHFWKDDFESTSSLQKLKNLTISGCGILDMLVPSSVSFRNLSYLKLDKCHRLTHLLNPSVARTLVQLEWLTLEGCKRMTTVIAGDQVVGEGNDEIVFNKLKYLYLIGLSKLTSFHSGKCIIRFPCLTDVIIGPCPEMKVFSLGITSTLSLLIRNIEVSNDYVSRSAEIVEDINGIVRQGWEDNYDFGIQHLFLEKNLEEDQADHSSSHVEE